MKYFIPVSEAKKIIESQIFRTEKITVSLLEAQGFFTSEPIFATLDVPSFNNSAMDGYGFRFDDLADFSELKVMHIIPAGVSKNNFELGRGEAVRIFTGAKIPDGVDTVIMQEKVTRIEDRIQFNGNEILKGENIRLKGSQTRLGTKIIEENTFINHAVIGFLSGFGIDKIAVYNKIKIGLLYTGNELVESGKPLLDGEIYNSNSYTLQSALAEINHGFSFINHVEDTEEATFSAIKKSLETIDVLLITGGISVGDYDYVKPALEKSGVSELFYKIRQKPGKPLYFGKLDKKMIFALPGNPASVFSCYHQYIKPFLLGCFGRKDFEEEKDFAISESFAKKKNKDQTQFLKACYSKGKVRILNAQESYKMDSAAQANCFVEFPEKATEINIGEKVTIWRV
ncbi:molybdopterin molybdotransferase MoeA [Chryseobacterium sp. SSA4.19]|uniref:molybdopterin molybdotransferase MoeA n=1 Tax=Chryseobacterium sp. SSA4.19 TaxID=2919915 RepID=UPI001F4EE1BE|nr:molybdopterin molybdotransferase MoeA [Chryseobacterium sp. SSA4.19]MCJ8154562.1 molybdopterin molybdotransferase MoeA [Chryseobacterium sp. SSA4.19]